MPQTAHVFAEGAGAGHMGYLLFLPAAYGRNGHLRWPLILFLHGAGERGHDIERLRGHGITRVVEERADRFPFVVVSPQCPEGSRWVDHLDTLGALLGEITRAYAIDEQRVYLTGMSMGGQGAWAMALRYPERFAAVAPICGPRLSGTDLVERMRVLVGTPVWVFHGAKDEVVPLEHSMAMADALEEVGGTVRLTVYPEAGHDAWTETYNNPALYEWFLQHALALAGD
jgi:predicted peptidase